MLDLSFNEKTNRLQKTLELVRSIAEKNEKCIIWTSFKYNINYLKVFLEKFNPVALDGSMQNDERKLSVTRFLEQEDTKVLIATPQSSKEGLTLTVSEWYARKQLPLSVMIGCVYRKVIRIGVNIKSLISSTK